MSKVLTVLCASVILAGHIISVSAEESASSSMSFFVTSENIGNGGNLGGLAGADAHCQALADAAGAGDRTWRAYLSTSTVNARDRIGQGPWHNYRGELIARDLTDLHDNNDNITTDNSYTELGTKMPGINDEGTMHDMLTGTGVDGTLALVQEGKAGIPEHDTGDPATCEDWTGHTGRARVGHFDSQIGEPGTVWNSAHYSLGCSQEDIERTASIGLFYCFASD